MYLFASPTPPASSRCFYTASQNMTYAGHIPYVLSVTPISFLSESHRFGSGSRFSGLMEGGRFREELQAFFVIVFLPLMGYAIMSSRTAWIHTSHLDALYFIPHSMYL